MSLIKEFNSAYNKNNGKKVLGLAGFFGYGNFGDELFLDVYAQFFKEDFNLKIMHDLDDKPYFSNSAKSAVESVDGIIIGGGDIVQPWGMDPRYFSFDYLSKPVFIAGVGVPIRADGANPNHVEKQWIIDKYKKFMNHSSVKFIHARDDESSNWISSKVVDGLNLTCGPDIVCALDLPVSATKSNSKKILGVVTRSRPGKEETDNFEEIRKSCEAFYDSGWEIRHLILGTGKVFNADLVSSVRLDFRNKKLVSAKTTTDLCKEISECDLLMSMKFHGSVVATMNCIPSVVLVPTNKNRNFMKRINRTDLLMSFESPGLLELAKNVPSPISSVDRMKLKNDAVSVMMKLKKSVHESV